MAKRPPLPRVIRAGASPSLPELANQVAAQSDETRTFLKEFAEQEYDVTATQARILWRASIG